MLSIEWIVEKGEADVGKAVTNEKRRRTEVEIIPDIFGAVATPVTICGSRNSTNNVRNYYLHLSPSSLFIRARLPHILPFPNSPFYS